MAEKQRLKSHISGLGIPLGATPTGADWCIKALHPSDPLTEVRGIPDQSAVPSVCMNYQSTFTLSPVSTTGTWSFNMSLLPHPVNFLYYNKTETATGTTTYGTFLNSQLDGTTHQEKYLSFKSLAQRWRLAYMSVTAYQDGPDLANQGSIVVCQTPSCPKKRCFSFPNIVTSTLTSATVESYTNEDMPEFTNSQAMPNAYFDRSRNGAYVPLKLTETCQDWKSENDEVSYGYIMPPADAMLDGAWGLLTPSTTVTGLYPHCTKGANDLLECNCLWNLGGLSNEFQGQETSPMLNGTIAHLCAKNLAAGTSFTFFVRAGFELQVTPSSVLSPQLKLSPPHDRSALDAYFAISRELKDGYPEEYNGKGKIWDVISKVGRMVLPFIQPLGPIGQGVAAVGNVALNAGDLYRRKQKKRRQKQKRLMVVRPVPPPKPKHLQAPRVNQPRTK